MICFPKISSMVPRNWRWYPKLCLKWLLGHFLDPQNDENWSYNKMCQEVWVPLGYHSTFWVPLGYHFGYHYDDFSYRKNWFFSKSQHLLAYFGYRMVPQWYPIFLFQSMKFQLSKTVSTVIVRCLEWSLTLFEISWTLQTYTKMDTTKLS